MLNDSEKLWECCISWYPNTFLFNKKVKTPPIYVGWYVVSYHFLLLKPASFPTLRNVERGERTVFQKLIHVIGSFCCLSSKDVSAASKNIFVKSLWNNSTVNCSTSFLFLCRLPLVADELRKKIVLTIQVKERLYRDTKKACPFSFCY